MNYWKTKTINGKFHMYYGLAAPNKYWEYFEPDYDTEKYYTKKAKLLNSDYAVIEINEDEI